MRYLIFDTKKEASVESYKILKSLLNKFLNLYLIVHFYFIVGKPQ